MPKRTSKAKKKKKKKKRAQQEPDVNQLAHRLVQESTTDSPEDTLTKTQISQLMSQMGRKGGKVGGKRRMEGMTTEQRSDFGLKAAQARWSKRKRPPKPKKAKKAPIETVYAGFGMRIRIIREALGITQLELSERLPKGVLTRTSIVNIEVGRQRVLLHHVVEFAHALGCSPTHLMRGVWW